MSALISTKDLQKRPTEETTKETNKRDIQRRPTKETSKRGLAKNPPKETCKRDL